MSGRTTVTYKAEGAEETVDKVRGTGIVDLAVQVRLSKTTRLLLGLGIHEVILW